VPETWPGQTRPLVIGVDFDGTVAEDLGVWGGPGVFGDPNPEVRTLLYELRTAGWVIVLWSCRGDVERMQQFCEAHDFPIDYYNENPYWHEERGDNPAKLKGDIYLDDKAVNPVGLTAVELSDRIAELINARHERIEEHGNR